MRQLRSSDYWKRHCGGGAERPSDLGRPIIILFPCVESGCFDADAGCPHDEHHAIEWIYGGGEGGDTSRGQHHHRDICEKVSESRGVPDELRERMEEFFGGPGAPFGPRGFRGPQGPW